MTEPADNRNRNFAQLAALSTVVGTMLGAMRAKGSLSQAEIDLIFEAAQAAAPDDAAGAQLIATVKALMIGVGDQPYRRPLPEPRIEKVTRIGIGPSANSTALTTTEERHILPRRLVGMPG